MESEITSPTKSPDILTSQGNPFTKKTMNTAFELPKRKQPLPIPQRNPGEFQQFIRKSNILHKLSDKIVLAAARKQRERIQLLTQRKKNLEAKGWVQVF